MVAGYARVAGSDGPRATAILRDMRDVRALEELREGFVATVSHELRTPLALVKGYAESLLCWSSIRPNVGAISNGSISWPTGCEPSSRRSST